VREVSASSKLVARKVVEAFGRRPKITNHLDVDEKNSVDIAAAADSPEPGITSYSTVTLSDWPMYVGGREHETRIEIAGAAPNKVEYFPNAIATAAFCVIKQKWACHPGVIFPDVMAMYHLSVTMKHVMFMEPFLWHALDISFRLPDRLVTWVMMIPIADSEYEFARAQGWQALGQLLEDRDIDVCDMQREPVV
jgi:hypothetical protein